MEGSSSGECFCMVQRPGQPRGMLSDIWKSSITDESLGSLEHSNEVSSSVQIYIFNSCYVDIMYNIREVVIF